MTSWCVNPRVPWRGRLVRRHTPTISTTLAQVKPHKRFSRIGLVTHSYVSVVFSFGDTTTRDSIHQCRCHRPFVADGMHFCQVLEEDFSGVADATSDHLALALEFVKVSLWILTSVPMACIVVIVGNLATVLGLWCDWEG